MSRSESPREPVRSHRTRILVINPNSSVAMSEGMSKVINTTDLSPSTEVSVYTAPSPAPASINNDIDIEDSTNAVMSDIHALSPHSYDAILVACFSVHTLVHELPLALRSSLSPSSSQQQPPVVTGIFESSILTALSLLNPGEKWGIVTTGKFWESHLTAGVSDFLGFSLPPPSSSPSTPSASPAEENSKFAGVQTTNLNASDFHHGVDPAIITQRLKDATKRLLAGGKTTVVVMGCAGMAGLEDTIRLAASEECGEDWAYGKLQVVDGVRAGLMGLESAVRCCRLRPGVKK